MTLSPSDTRARVLVAMSGGVDSSVAAKLLLDEGYDCVGGMMRLYDGPEDVTGARTCCSLDDAEDARQVARRLGVPFYVFNCKDAFRACVMEPFARAYERGCTPNPCIECNRTLKFGELYRRALALGCTDLATGHYARIAFENGRYLLKTARDDSKDQSYVLWSLTQQMLAHLHFPLGELTKAEARAIAEREGFVNARKHDSQDICFVPDGDYAAAVEAISGHAPQPGPFLDPAGNRIGTHRGIIHYTLGQRRGLAIPAGERVYVTEILPEQNAVVVGPPEDLMRTRACADRFNWIAGEAPKGKFSCEAKIRYRQKRTPVTVWPEGEDRVRLEFDEPQRAVTPGQSAVLYDGDTVLGGGILLREEEGTC